MAKKKVCRTGLLKMRESTAVLKDPLQKYVSFVKLLDI